MKRQKRVFSSHSQVCHVWAQQTQAEGRAGNIFFSGDTIYSYGHHYAAGIIHVVKGKKFALVRSDAYSPSTGQHLSEIRGSLRGLMPYFWAPTLDPREALEHLDTLANESFGVAMKRIKVTSQEGITSELARIQEHFNDANELRAILGLKARAPKAAAMHEVRAYLEKRHARWIELESRPHRVEAKRFEDERREAYRRESAARDAEDLLRFRAGERVHVDGDYDLLQITGDLLRTSRGAEVPLAHAVRLYRDLKSGGMFADSSVGEFKFQSIDRTLADPVIVIGCHRILMSEADEVIGAYLACRAETRGLHLVAVEA